MLLQRRAHDPERLCDPEIGPAEFRQQLDFISVFTSLDVRGAVAPAPVLRDRVVGQIEIIGHRKNSSVTATPVRDSAGDRHSPPLTPAAAAR